jgi:hypothetical protein
MPSEIRHLVFSEEEALVALREYCRKSGKPLSDHALLHLKIVGQTPPFAMLATDASKGQPATNQRISTEDLLSALILYCHGNRIPLPVRGNKTLSVLNDRLAVVVSLPRPVARIRAA